MPFQLTQGGINDFIVHNYNEDQPQRMTLEPMELNHVSAERADGRVQIAMWHRTPQAGYPFWVYVEADPQEAIRFAREIHDAAVRAMSYDPANDIWFDPQP